MFNYHEPAVEILKCHMDVDSYSLLCDLPSWYRDRQDFFNLHIDLLTQTVLLMTSPMQTLE